MYLIYGVLVLFAVVLFWSIALVLCRKPKTVWYNSESMQAYFWAPLGASGLCLGVLMVVKAFLKFSPSAVHMLVAAALFAATVVMGWFLGRWTRHVDSSVGSSGAKIIPLGTKDHAETPAPEPTRQYGNKLNKAA